jgi:PQQ-dependent catabolism-associated CXXCW motif protein
MRLNFLSVTPPTLIDVMPNPIRFLPGAAKNNDMGSDLTRAGDSAGQRFLEQQVKAKTNSVVFYCMSWECWLSYNAALRAVSLGYTDVYWYRGGIFAWFDAELPLEVAK